jgi:hypothetical protein
MAQQNSPNRPKRHYFGPDEKFIYCHDDTYLRQEEVGYCGICNKKTRYKSVYAAEYVCSPECSNELWCDITERLASIVVRRKRGK